MVELKLEALDFANPEKDTYVAVRVGENQKLARLSASRTFKFPESALGDRKFGKVDIFKRIGSASVGIRHDPDMQSQELQVPCNEGMKINFRVTLADKPIPSEKSGKENAPAMQEAKTYLMDHNLEMVLSDAMQAVLRERPKNPTQFICEKLQQSEGTYRRVPTDEKRAQTAPAGDNVSRTPAAGGADVEALRQQAKQTLLQATSSGKLDSALAKAKESKGPTGPEEVMPDVEALRQQAKQTLLEATSSGKLDVALSKVKDSQAAPGSGAALAPDTEALRQQAKNTLLAATNDGTLDVALGKLKDTKAVPGDGPDTEALRQQAKQTLLEATNSGKLDTALAKLKDSKAEPGTGQEGSALAPDTEALRQQAKQTLLEATNSGKLDVALGKLKDSKVSPEGLSVQAVSAGAAVASDGAAAPDPKVEALRKQAKQSLLNATADGKLDSALGKLKAVKAATGSMGEADGAVASDGAVAPEAVAPEAVAPDGAVAAEAAPEAADAVAAAAEPTVAPDGA